MSWNLRWAFLVGAVGFLPAGHSVQINPPDRLAKGANKTNSAWCKMDLETLRPSITPADLNFNSWEEMARKHLIEWLPEQKTTQSRSGFSFTGPGMCPDVKFGTERKPVGLPRNLARPYP